MATIFLAMLVFFVVIVFIVIKVTTTIAGVIASVIRVVLPGGSEKPLPPLNQVQQAMQRCRRANCRSVNPAFAGFCRRCGMALRATNGDSRTPAHERRQLVA